MRHLVLWGSCLVLAVGLRLFDPWGDRGMVNVLTQGLFLLAVALSVTREAARRDLALRRRLAPLGVVLLLALGVAVFFPPAGFSGEMVPRFRARFARPERAPAARATTPAAAALFAPGRHDFAHFLGPTGDQRVSGPALDTRAEARPRERWRRPIGSGWSAFALVGGVGVTLAQDEAGQHVLALALDDGRELWRTQLDARFEHVLGGDGPRATPAIADGRVFVLSAHGVLAALEFTSGRELWRHDLVAEGGLERAREAGLAQYGRSCSPLVVDGLVLVPGGGNAGLVAFEVESGARRWASPPRHFSHASPALARLHGRTLVLVVNEDTLTGHALADGRVLFEHPWPGTTSGDASVSQALAVDEEHVLLTKGYGQGGLLLRLAPVGSELVPEVRWHAPRLLRTKLTNVVVHAGHVYALDDGILECVELATGAKRWKEGRYGHGQILALGDTLLVQGEDGVVSAVALSPEQANQVHWSFQALEGKCWAHLALSAELLVLRNDEECAAFELPLARGGRSEPALR